MKRKLLILAGAGLAAGLLVSSAFAKGPVGGGGGSDRRGGPPAGGGGGEEGAVNSLSVPAVLVPSATGAPPLNFVCGDAVLPTGETTYFSNPLAPAPAGDYYLQGEDKGQASCATDPDGLNVSADWGDNLVSAPLKAGTPVRVEIGLLADDAASMSMTGFMVYKLTNELDRLATYGTLGAAETPYAEVRAWDAGTRLEIVRSDGLVVYSGPFTAEINSTGRVVYGYNWKKPLAGAYTITVTAPNVEITAVPEGTLVGPHTAQIEVDVTPKVRGGGKKDPR